MVLAVLAIVGRGVDAQWRVDSRPVVDIGSADGRDEYLFKRPVPARMRDGRIVVADPYAADVRVFDAKGSFMSRIGRKGRGPGEFLTPFWAGIGKADTLFIFDYGEGRGVLNRFTPDFRFINSAFIQSTQAFGSQPMRLLPDGSLLLHGSNSASYGPRDRPQPYRGEESVIRFARPDKLSVIGHYFGQIIDDRAMYPWGQVDGTRAASDSLIFIGDGETFAISAYGLDGTLRRSVTKDMPTRTITDAHKSEWRQRQRELAEANPQRKVAIERALGSVTFPKYFPATTRTWIADTPGNLWVGLYTTLVYNESTDYVVFSPNLVEIARVTLPPRFVPHEIGADYVLGVWLDGEDVPHVRSYRLTK